MEYTKGPLPFNEQIEHLKSKGLSFADEAKALHTLQHISYFRLKSYLRATMYDRKTRTYKSGATFEQAYELYKFDSRLRKLIIAEMESGNKGGYFDKTPMSGSLSLSCTDFW